MIAQLMFEFLLQVIKDGEIIFYCRVLMSLFKKLKLKMDDNDMLWSNVRQVFSIRNILVEVNLK